MGPFINVSGRLQDCLRPPSYPASLYILGTRSKRKKTVLNVGVLVGLFYGVFAAAMDARVATALAALVTAVGAAHGCACVCVCVCVCGGGGGGIKYTIDWEILT